MIQTEQTRDTPQQDRRCIHNKTLRCVHATIVALEDQSITYS